MADEHGLPDADDLRKLPRWACVAFAARCARRVEPLFEAVWPQTPSEHVKAVQHAIEIAAGSAAARADAYAAEAAADEARAAAKAAADEARAANTYAAEAAALAAEAAALAYADDAYADDAYPADAYAAAALAAVAAALAAFRTDVQQCILADYQSLLTAAESERWTDDTPVPPEFFGPLWPDGEPEGWPESLDVQTVEAAHNLIERAGGLGKRESGETRTGFDIWIDPGNASKETIQHVLECLSDLYRAAGGLGLEFKSDDQSVYAVQGVAK